MNNHRKELSKDEIACSHIESAIYLLFDNKGAISAYFLAHSAHDMLADVLKKKGIKSLRETNFQNNELELSARNDFFREYNKCLNFAKHSDKDDPDDKLEFYDYYADLTIFTAIGDYNKLTNSPTNTMKFFCTYFKVVYKEQINKENGFDLAEINYTERQRCLEIAKQKLHNMEAVLELT